MTRRTMTIWGVVTMTKRKNRIRDMDWIAQARALRALASPLLRAAEDAIGEIRIEARESRDATGSISIEGQTLSIVGPVDWFAGVDVLPIAQQLVEDPPDSLDLYVDSPGGSLFDGLALRAALDHVAAKGTTINSRAGAAVGSVAVPIYLAGSTRTAQSYSQFMVHAPRGAAIIAGTLAETDAAYRDYRAALEAATDLYRDIVAAAIGNRASVVAGWIAEGDQWFSASEARGHGLVTAIADGETPDDGAPEPEVSALAARNILAAIAAARGIS